jgi:hypothetical protein
LFGDGLSPLKARECQQLVAARPDENFEFIHVNGLARSRGTSQGAWRTVVHDFVRCPIRAWVFRHLDMDRLDRRTRVPCLIDAPGRWRCEPSTRSAGCRVSGGRFSRDGALATLAAISVFTSSRSLRVSRDLEGSNYAQHDAVGQQRDHDSITAVHEAEFQHVRRRSPCRPHIQGRPAT